MLAKVDLGKLVCGVTEVAYWKDLCEVFTLVELEAVLQFHYSQRQIKIEEKTETKRANIDAELSGIKIELRKINNAIEFLKSSTQKKINLKDNTSSDIHFCGNKKTEDLVKKFELTETSKLAFEQFTEADLGIIINYYNEFRAFLIKTKQSCADGSRLYEINTDLKQVKRLLGKANKVISAHKALEEDQFIDTELKLSGASFSYHFLEAAKQELDTIEFNNIRSKAIENLKKLQLK